MVTGECCSELKELVKMHGSHENEDPLSFDEVIILKVCTHTHCIIVKYPLPPSSFPVGMCC